TPDYRIDVRSGPLVEEFKATYHYRPYLVRVDRVSTERTLEAWRGTQVTLDVLANRPIREGWAEVNTAKGPTTLKATITAGDARRTRLSFGLEQSGQYRLGYHATDGESYLDPMTYAIKVHLDKPPQVVLTEPGKDVEKPVNSMLKLKGRATDDI